ncbi:hypothetical protein BPNPMPFG_000305 [Mesorhizobium sp. AR07]|uniref:hypothetical protein n=1 Tax=Mesorhizobium sp. AR07 TaxID=2865838 RepID=UPI00215F0DF4|nr:hypothetical protein [Mesorhizobium sp. AR07]UVK44840.1 hypothetical protein BPNPMPFG_000305 [Mesorhizobium sp. AR07]
MIDEIQTPALPVLVPKITIVAIATRDASEPSTAEAKIVFLSNGVRLFEMPAPVQFHDKFRARVVAEIQGIIIPGSGKLRVAYYQGDNEIASWDMAVVLVGAPTMDLFNTTSPQ